MIEIIKEELTRKCGRSLFTKNGMHYMCGEFVSEELYPCPYKDTNWLVPNHGIQVCNCCDYHREICRKRSI